MSTPKKKPSLNGLPGTTTLTEGIREKLGVDKKVLTIHARLWVEPSELVDDYFENHQVDFLNLAKNAYNIILSVLLKISIHNKPEGSRTVISQQLQEYSTKVHKFLSQEHIYEEFERFYKLKEIEARKKLEANYTEKEGEVAEELLERRSLVRLGKRVEREIDADKENKIPSNIKIVKTSKSFNIHHPQLSTSTPNTPRLQKEDYEILDPIANIKYRSTMQKSTDDIETVFKQSHTDERSNLSLKSIPGAVELLKNTVFHNDHAFKNKYLWEDENSSPFLNAMKYIIADYYQNCLVQIPHDFGDERTFFCEIVIPILKTFAIHNKNMSFKWCEKESKENKSTWLQDNDYRPKNTEKRFLDGYGISENRGIAIMIESSGSESNVTHSIEDSVKQIKNATDFLTYLKTRFKDSSALSFTKLRTPTLLLIHNQLTMTTTSLGWSKKWQVIDVRTATIPTTKEGKHNLVKVFELLAHLKEIWEEQQKIVADLEAEAVGFGEEFEETVEDHFSYQESQP
ncbi:hypothetical protein K501DRAFT_249487 [Backusella circina FSU 941]|nr:hypothetical protein K501DRAFT_249487 [Backusella circina FSU 941]